MGKKPGKRRQTVRAWLKLRQAEAVKQGGEVCSVCGQAVAFDAATFYRSGGEEVVYCLDCAFSGDSGGYVALLREAFDRTAPERGREGAALTPSGARD
jgi:hypothetical protein